MLKASASAVILLLGSTLTSPLCLAKTYTAEDVLAFTRMANVVASPDATEVALITWGLSETDSTHWKYTLSLKDQRGNIKEITHADYLSSIDWSPDGKSLGYIAASGDQQTLSIYQLSTQQILPIVTLSRSIDALKISPDGKQIAFVADEEPSPKAPENLLINADRKFTNSQLYLIQDIHPHAVFKPITPADIMVSQPVFGGGFDWSPTGQEIAFNYQPSPKAMDDKKSQIAILDLKTLKFTPIEYCNTHTCVSPMYSPDGNWLAFSSNILATAQQPKEQKALLEDIDTQSQICVVHSTTPNQTHCLPQNTPNGDPYLLGWNANNQGVYVADMYQSEGPQLYELGIDGKTPAKQISIQKEFIESLTMSLNKTGTTFGFGMESPNTAPEAFISQTDHFKLNQITHINQKLNRPLGNIQVLNWASKDGTAIQGLFITPVNYDPKKKYPLYLDIHGGPASQQEQNRYLGGCDEYSEAFPTTSCPATVLNLGYVILQVNYRGSNAYGLDFRLKNFKDFGGGDFQDLMTGIDYLNQKGLINPDKIAIAGWSYGGYLTNWSITQSPIFYKAIDGEGITNFISYTGTSDDTDFFLRYMGSYFWEAHQALYWDRSPIAHVKNIHTPLLIFEGERDIRVPPSQPQELYTALKLLNQPVTMLLAPNQSHEPTDPATISQEIKAIDQWLESPASS
jgi:dipeptidyl aminopeptidase/acylaminoacyl peptidase